MEESFGTITGDKRRVIRLLQGENVTEILGPTTQRNRVTSTGYVFYHTSNSNENVTLSMNGELSLSTTDEALKRTLKLSTLWQRIDYGWVKSPRLIAIRNTLQREYIEQDQTVCIRIGEATCQLYLPVEHGQVFHIDSNFIIDICSKSNSLVTLLIVPN